MSDEYTPTTEQVLSTYLGGTLIEFREEGFGRFDRWLAEVERAAAEKAWDEGANALSVEMVPDSPTARVEGMKVRITRPTNPYRKAVQS